MNARQIFIKGHQVARSTRDLFETYQGAFASALRRIYAGLRAKIARKVARKAAWNLQEAKQIALAAARSAQIKNNMEKVAVSVAADTQTVEQKLAEGAWNEDLRFGRI